MNQNLLSYLVSICWQLIICILRKPLNHFETDEISISVIISVQPRNEIRLSVRSLGVALDREETADLAVIIRCSDGKHDATASIKVLVDDLNDQPPTFEHASYNFSILENNPLGMQSWGIGNTGVQRPFSSESSFA